MNQIKTNTQPNMAIYHCLSQLQRNIFFIKGDLIDNKQSLFSEFSQALNFPKEWGQNWDAFYDCLTDLSWLDTQEGVIIIYENFNNLQMKNQKDWLMTSQIFVETIDYWNGQKTPITMVFQ